MGKGIGSVLGKILPSSGTSSSNVEVVDKRVEMEKAMQQRGNELGRELFGGGLMGRMAGGLIGMAAKQMGAANARLMAVQVCEVPGHQRLPALFWFCFLLLFSVCAYKHLKHVGLDTCLVYLGFLPTSKAHMTPVHPYRTNTTPSTSAQEQAADAIEADPRVREALGGACAVGPPQMSSSMTSIVNGRQQVRVSLSLPVQGANGRAALADVQFVEGDDKVSDLTVNVRLTDGTVVRVGKASSGASSYGRSSSFGRASTPEAQQTIDVDWREV